jgi:hypothetical protein
MFFHYLSLYTIKTIHFGIFNYIVLTPFVSKNKDRLLFHSYLILMIMLHWYFNDDNCCLSMLEFSLRKKIYKNVSMKECLTYKILSPIYKFNNNKNFSKFSYLAMSTLFGFTICKLLLI